MAPSPDPPRTVDIDEVIPPGRRGAREPERAKSTSRLVASLMDDCIRIPGTNIRFGLDPILGLFPGAGDTLASLVGIAIIGEASRKGVARGDQVRMAVNILANAAVGTVPVLGDAFSVWFKSNRRNFEILNSALAKQVSPEERARAIRRGRWFGIALMAGVIAVVVLIVIGAVTVLTLLIGVASSPAPAG